LKEPVFGVVAFQGPDEVVGLDGLLDEEPAHVEEEHVQPEEADLGSML
jgi:hypothetical protein